MRRLDLDQDSHMEIALTRAYRLGIADVQSRPPKTMTIKKVMTSIGVGSWRLGHQNAIRAVYRIGKFNESLRKEMKQGGRHANSKD